MCIRSVSRSIPVTEDLRNHNLHFTRCIVEERVVDERKLAPGDARGLLRGVDAIVVGDVLGVQNVTTDFAQEGRVVAFS